MEKSMNSVERNRTIIKLIFVLVFINIFCSCKKQPDNQKIESTVLKDNQILYKDISNLNIKNNYTKDPVKSLDIKFQEYEFNIRYIEERAYIQYKIGNKVVQDWQALNINFYYNSSYEFAEKDIHLLYSTPNSEGILLLPSFTEEFSSYFMYKFDKKKVEYIKDISASASYLNNSKVKGNFKGVEYENKIDISYFDEKGNEYKFSDRKDEVTINKDIYNSEDLLLLLLNDKKSTNKYIPTFLNETSWAINCSSSERNIMFENDQTLVISMEFNQYYITLQEKSREGNIIYYKYKEMSGLGSVDYNSEFYNNAETVCSIEILNENTLKFDWLGFYDKKAKKRLQIENPLDEKKKLVELKKCE